MESSPYFIMTNGTSKEHKSAIKIKVIRYAKEHGIKPAARKWGCSPNSVREWIRRFEAEGSKGLLDRRKGPHHIPHKTCQKIENQIISIRKKIPCFGPKRIQYFFDIKCSEGAIKRILRQNKVTRKRRKKYQKKNDLREVKARYQTMDHLQMDIKYLRDIPVYWEQIQSLGLPRFQYTLRDTKSGMLFLGFSDELSELNTRTMIDLFLNYLNKIHPSLENITIQTDNGVEFGGLARSVERSGFLQTIVQKYKAQHVFIPPRMCNANADVESSHQLIEEEFFNLTHFKDRKDFLEKAESYCKFFNVARPNFHKKAKTPWLIAEQDWPLNNLASKAVAFPVLDLDKIGFIPYNHAVQSFPVLPGQRIVVI